MLETLQDAVSLSEVAALLPSPRRGRRTDTATVYRLAKKAGMTILRRGRFRFLLRSELDLLYQREPLEREKPRGKTSLATKRRLKELGLG